MALDRRDSRSRIFTIQLCFLRSFGLLNAPAHQDVRFDLAKVWGDFRDALDILATWSMMLRQRAAAASEVTLLMIEILHDLI